jgi:TrmH RNA methyltransferase
MKKQRSEEVVYGYNASRAVFSVRPQSIIRCYLDISLKQKFADELKFLAKTQKAYHLVERSELDKLTSSTHHEGISLLVKKRPLVRPVQTFSKLVDRGLIVALSGVANPHNIGAIARSAAHFGADGLILPEKFEPPASAYRVAEGGLEHLLLASGDYDDLLELKREGFTLIAPSPHGGKGIRDYRFPKRSVIIFGSEGEGLDVNFERQCDALVNIEGSSKVESLNVATAASVILFQAAAQRA